MHFFFMIELIALSLIYIRYLLLTISQYISEPITSLYKVREEVPAADPNDRSICW